MRASSSRLRALGWPALLVLGVVVFYAPVVLLGRSFFLKDTQLVTYPLSMALRDRLLSGDLPEWLPGLDLGLPFLANPSHRALYPLSMVLLLPAPYSVGLFLVCHVALGAAGMFWLSRALRLSASAAGLAALSFALGGYMVSLTWGADYMLGLAWAPLVTRMALRVLEGGNAAQAALTALVWSCQILCGEPQSVLLTGWLVVALALGWPAARTTKLRRMAVLGASVALAVCLALPQILPALELLPRSRRAHGIGIVEAQHWSLHPLRLLELAAPWLFGNPLRADEFLGFFMNDEGSALHRDPWMVTPYLGSLALLLSILGMVAARQRHRWWARSLTLLTAFALLLALGRHTPVFAAYYAVVPGAGLFRYPAKFFGLCALTVPLLAAAGGDAWLFERRRHEQLLRLVAALAATLALGVAMAGPAAVELAHLSPAVVLANARTTWQSACFEELAGLAAVALGLVWCTRRAPAWRGPALLSAAAFQLSVANFAAYETAPSSIYSERPQLAERLLSRTPPGEVPRVMVDLARLSVPGLDAAPGEERAKAFSASLMKNLGILFGVSYARAYVSSGEGAKHRLWQQSVAWRRQLLDVFGIRFLILGSPVPAAAAIQLKPLTDSGAVGAVVYENPKALPFAYAVGQLVPAPTQIRAMEYLKDERFARGLLAVGEGTELEVPRRLHPERTGSCRLLAPPVDTLRFTCRLRRPGFVVVNESHHPNWQARVDGHPTPIVRANALVMAVRVSAGTHRVDLRYAEPSLGIAFAASALALFVCVLLVLRERWQHVAPG